MTALENVICPKCHHMRTAILKMPCEHCGARQTLFGYLWLHEYQGYMLIAISILVLILLAGLAALVFWVILQSQSQQVNVGTNLVVFSQSLNFMSWGCAL